MQKLTITIMRFLIIKNNIKQTWKLINDLICSRKSRTQIRKIIVNNEEITKDHDIASHFNNYFSNIPISLNHEIPNSATQPCDFCQCKLS